MRVFCRGAYALPDDALFCRCCAAFIRSRLRYVYARRRNIMPSAKMMPISRETLITRACLARRHHAASRRGLLRAALTARFMPCARLPLPLHADIARVHFHSDGALCSLRIEALRRRDDARCRAELRACFLRASAPMIKHINRRIQYLTPSSTCLYYVYTLFFFFAFATHTPLPTRICCRHAHCFATIALR